MAAVQNLTVPVERGDTFSFEFNWDDGATPTPAPIDMRGKEVVLTIKISPHIPDAEAPVLVSVTPAMDDVDAEAGKVVVTVPASQSVNLIAGATHHYACRVITTASPENIEVTHVKGTVPVEDA